MSKRRLIQEAVQNKKNRDQKKAKSNFDTEEDDENVELNDYLEKDDKDVKPSNGKKQKQTKREKQPKQQEDEQQENEDDDEPKDGVNMQTEISSFIQTLKERDSRPKVWHNKQRVLLLCSRGTTAGFRHVFNNLKELLPHHKTEAKFDTKRELSELNEVADLRACNNCLFFESRKNDCFLWASKIPNGPTVKFQVLNAHSAEEFAFTGNCLKGTRPILSFDAIFDTEPQLQLMKELLSQIFGTPKGHPHSKPFVDHIFSFFYVDGKIWFRNYQIVNKDKKEDPELVEIGPRFILEPIKIFANSFTGPILYQNGQHIAPSVRRAVENKAKKSKSSKSVSRVIAKFQHDAKIANIMDNPEDPLDHVFDGDDDE